MRKRELPSKRDVAKTAAAGAAASAAPSVLPFVVGGVALLVLWKALPKIGDVALDAAAAAAGAAAEGTGDFFKGIFTGAERTETPITTAIVGDTVYRLTPGTTLGTFDTWDPNLTTKYTVQYDEGGLPTVRIDNPSAMLPPPTFSFFEDAPLAQRVGADVAPYLQIPGGVGPLGDVVDAVTDAVSTVKSLWDRVF